MRIHKTIIITGAREDVLEQVRHSIPDGEFVLGKIQMKVLTLPDAEAARDEEIMSAISEGTPWWPGKEIK